jgi:hypothetical protein
MRAISGTPFLKQLKPFREKESCSTTKLYQTGKFPYPYLKMERAGRSPIQSLECCEATAA